jgi:hypothetical protein
VPIRLKENKLLIVEGKSDRAMITALLSKHDIAGIDVFSPFDHNGTLGGEDAIRQLLDGIAADRNFGRLERLVLLVDADEDPGGKLTKMQNILRSTQPVTSAGLRYPVPTALDTFVGATGVPSIAVSLLPGGGQLGAMESLCWQAGSAPNNRLIECITAFGDCVGIADWSPQKRDKFKLRCLITSACAVNPDLPTTNLWTEVPELVPLDSPVFDPLVAFIRAI